MQDLWQEFSQQVAEQSLVEWGAVIGAVLYLYLATKENPWCWFWGIISCFLWCYAAFFNYQLYLDAGLQLFYVGISFWGLYQWRYGGGQGANLLISKMTTTQNVAFVVLGLGLSLLLGYVFANWTEAAAPYWDALTTVFSVMITFLVIFKKLENWAYWFVIDSIYVGLYWSRGGYLFALLFVFYLFLVVVGWYRWRKAFHLPEKEGAV